MRNKMSKKSETPRKEIILTLYPNTRGFGYAVMENALTLVEAQIVTVRPLSHERNLNSLKEMIDYFEPTLVILENYDHPSSRKAKRIKELIDAVKDYVQNRNISTKAYSRSDIRFAFSNFNAHTKHEIATVICENIPKLKTRLMPPRKVYESEKYTAGIFDAVSLGITHFYLEP
jgi:hypothetical protein